MHASHVESSLSATADGTCHCSELTLQGWTAGEEAIWSRISGLYWTSRLPLKTNTMVHWSTNQKTQCSTYHGPMDQRYCKGRSKLVDGGGSTQFVVAFAGEALCPAMDVYQHIDMHEGMSYTDRAGSWKASKNSQDINLSEGSSRRMLHWYSFSEIFIEVFFLE